MAANPTGSPPQAAHDEPIFHNPVLTRTHEPARAHSSPWMVVVPIILALAVGAGVWAYVQGHPAAPVVNHAVGPEPGVSG
jgi:hypothetical protein